MIPYWIEMHRQIDLGLVIFISIHHLKFEFLIRIAIRISDHLYFIWPVRLLIISLAFPVLRKFSPLRNINANQ